MKMSLIARTTSKIVAPFLVTYAAYLILYGAYSPGGGFQAGVILAVAVILLITSHGYKKVKKRFRGRTVSYLESLSSLGIALLIALVALAYLRPRDDIVTSFNVLVGIKVGAAFVLIFYSLIAFLERD
ncbi:Na(+)/H(+) antiporter subunit B [Pyrococcus abyssi]|uniref:Multisubunit Na+/H+ antiporter MnhB subunit, putative n=1 Tax=Pyrococcus abyssi (strain GE5 / Orsay) TaxID=272844 RepID=Q9UZE2_PYRAB|nr:Na(+)/H(+) antiporter subunit B [Pyrococcus abyssi]CAB50117.1 Multisubunit Na+/H+ antiporter MnhB subunit, putative [Pyrococcus abyssi GE5]CCE70641.1 TPA: putative monovalent cation/H+ antiporter subunit B [Pyrococcus abyssi GE5]